MSNYYLLSYSYVFYKPYKKRENLAVQREGMYLLHSTYEFTPT